MDWERAVYTVLVSRALDELEETRLLPERKVLYQFTARGHDVTQALLGQMLTGARDGVGVRSRARLAASVHPVRTMKGRAPTRRLALVW